MRFPRVFALLFAPFAVAACGSSPASDASTSAAGGSTSTTSTTASGGGGSTGGSGGSGAGPQIAPDPTGWQATGALHDARALATATVLADGRVLVVGGEDANYGMLASVELYDPAAGTFSAGSPLPEPRDHHTATLLESGKVLIAGGGQGSEISLPNGEKALASALLFDPDTGAWQPTGSMNEARAGHRAVRLDDGRVLVVGGGNMVGYSCAAIHPNCTVADSIGSAEIYDPKAGTWTVTGALAQPRLAFDLHLTPFGAVASGGGASNHGLTSVEIFDVSAGKWHTGASLAGQRLYHSAVVLGGKLIVAGGKIANVGPITSVDILPNGASKWLPGASLKEPRTGASFVALQSGKGLIVAGNDQLGTNFLAQAALYDVDADTWTTIKPLAHGRYSQASVLLKDGSVLVLGGHVATGVTNSAERSH